METITQSSESITGAEIHCDEAKLIEIKSKAREALQPIESLISNYKALNLDKPFDQEMFERFINGNGPQQEIAEFQSVIDNDLKKFKSDVVRSSFQTNAGDYSASIFKSIRAIQNIFAQFPVQTSYTLSTKDFAIRNEHAELLTDGIKKHCTVYASDLQADVYEQLTKLEDAYNGVIEFLKNKNIQIGSRSVTDIFNGKSLISADNPLFRFEVIGKMYNGGDQLGARIEVNKTALINFQNKTIK